MIEAIFIKTPSGLYPSTETDKELLKEFKLGQGVRIKLTKVRDRELWQHRKYFALLNFAYDCWEPEAEYKGLPVEKEFTRFRHDIAIAAGFSKMVINIKGEVRAEADSISFHNMDQATFEKLYEATVDVVLKYILKNYQREDVDYVINELMEYAK